MIKTPTERTPNSQNSQIVMLFALHCFPEFGPELAGSLFQNFSVFFQNWLFSKGLRPLRLRLLAFGSRVGVRVCQAEKSLEEECSSEAPFESC